MKVSWRLMSATAALAVMWAVGVMLVERVAAQGQPATTAARNRAGEVFKNVTTSALKELSVDDFVASMGVITADLGLDCADCHPNAGSDQADFVTDNPRKNTTRRMVEMVAAINRTNFAGVQRVTCWSCHHGRITPATTIDLDAYYNAPNSENDDVVRPDAGQPSVDQVFDKYIQALGGAQRLAGLT